MKKETKRQPSRVAKLLALVSVVFLLLGFGLATSSSASAGGDSSKHTVTISLKCVINDGSVFDGAQRAVVTSDHNGQLFYDIVDIDGAVVASGGITSAGSVETFVPTTKPVRIVPSDDSWTNTAQGYAQPSNELCNPPAPQPEVKVKASFGAIAECSTILPVTASWKNIPQGADVFAELLLDGNTVHLAGGLATTSPLSENVDLAEHGYGPGDSLSAQVRIAVREGNSVSFHETKSETVVIPDGCDNPDPSVGISLALDECAVVGTISHTGMGGEWVGYGYLIGTSNPPAGDPVWLGDNESDSFDFSIDGLDPGTYFVQGIVIDYMMGLEWRSGVVSIVVPQSCDTTVVPPVPPIIPPSPVECPSGYDRWVNPNLDDRLTALIAQASGFPSSIATGVNVEGGNLSIVDATSWDGYEGRSAANQTAEVWSVSVAGKVFGSTRDIPDGMEYGQTVTDLGSLETSGGELIVVHTGDGSSANSVVPVSFCWKLVTPTTPTEPTVPPTEPTTPPTEPPTAPPATQPPTTPAPTGTVPVAPNTDGSGSGMTVAWLLIVTGLALGGGLIVRRKLSS